MKLRGCFFLFVSVFLSSCMSEDLGAPGFRITSLTFDFDETSSGWVHGFADYPSDATDSAYALGYEYKAIPGTSKKGVMLTGNNHSDDLFMYIKHKVEDLDPNTQYTITFDVKFASDAKAGQSGIGGAPGESVFMKVGAANVEPKTLIEDDMFVMNIDKGDQSENGANMVVVGNVAVPENSDGFVEQSRTNSPYNTNYNTPIVVTSNNDGELWLIVGTDSGFEGVTTIYYMEIAAVLSQVK